MGVTKTELFSDTQNELASAAKAFDHPARVAILQYLLKSQACVNGELVQELGLAQATISQHLRELKEIGVIQGSIEGTRINYCINPERWQRIKTQFNTFFDLFQSNATKPCCD
ncbi:metalloregulator ArsR/SmtB family transcription factor [Robiginitalea sp.]|jgi:predicted transcriptional regulator|nr:metalloregulator ArsR/SmtB family transcription factor [Robiginitalea sp.]